MKNNKYSILKIVCYALSFPLFLICAVITGSRVVKAGGSYGLMAWVGIIFAFVFSLIWAVIVLIYELKIKKATDKKATVKKQTKNLAIASFVLLAGLMLILDIALPPLLPGPTSNTIFYEDLADDYMGRAELNKGLLDEFIARNVTIGNIGKCPLVVNPDGTSNINKVNAEIEKYQKQGMKNEEVKSFLDRNGKYCQFNSFNLSGYESFVGPWLDMANDGRMTVPAIVNLIIAQRNPIQSGEVPGSVKWNEDGTKALASEWHDFYMYNPETKKIEAVKYQWTILDMMGTPLVVDLSGTIGEEGLEAFIINLVAGLIGEEPIEKDLGIITISIVNKDGVVTINDMPITDILEGSLVLVKPYDLINSVLETLAETLGNPAIATAPIKVKIVDKNGNTDNYILVDENGEPVLDSEGETTTIIRNYFNKNGTALSIEPNNKDRGVLDYQSHAWLDSNGLVFALCSIMSIRKVCYIFSGICVLLALLGGYFREKEIDSKLSEVA